MPVIPTPSSHRFPWYVRIFFWNQKRRYGRVLEPARLWGRTPKVFALLYGALDRRTSPIEPALAYADAVTDSNRQASPDHFEQLRRHFDDDAIIELTALIAFQNLSSKFNAAFGVEPQGFCAVPRVEQ